MAASVNFLRSASYSSGFLKWCFGGNQRKRARVSRRPLGDSGNKAGPGAQECLEEVEEEPEEEEGEERADGGVGGGDDERERDDGEAPAHHLEQRCGVGARRGEDVQSHDHHAQEGEDDGVAGSQGRNRPTRGPAGSAPGRSRAGSATPCG